MLSYLYNNEYGDEILNLKEFKTTDKEAYDTYERIFVEVLTKRIEQCKLEDIEKQKKAKEEAKDKKKKGKK